MRCIVELKLYSAAKAWEKRKQCKIIKCVTVSYNYCQLIHSFDTIPLAE